MLAIGAAIVLGIISAIVMLLFLIPVGGLGAVAVIAGMAAGLTWNLYTITLAVVAGSLAIFYFAVHTFVGFSAGGGFLSGLFHPLFCFALSRAGCVAASSSPK